MSDNTGTVIDNTPADTQVEPASEQTAYSIDDLLNLSSEEYPELADDVSHSGMKPLAHWMKHVPEDVRKHLGNFRADYSRKTQALAAERNQLRAELEAERQQLAAERAALYNGSAARKAAELAADTTEHDLFDQEGMKKEIQRQAAIMLQEMLKPAQEELQLQERKMKLNQFTSEHPEIKSDEYRLPIAQLLQERPELNLEDAYYIVKAKVDTARKSSEEAKQQEERKTRREAFSKTSTGAAASPTGAPKFTGPNAAWQAYQWHSSNAAKK